MMAGQMEKMLVERMLAVELSHHLVNEEQGHPSKLLSFVAHFSELFRLFVFTLQLCTMENFTRIIRT